MATPIFDRIMDNRVAAIGSVSGGDYASTLLVKEPDYTADAVADGVCIVNEGDWTYEDNPPLGMDGILQLVEVAIYVRGGSERNYQRLCRQYASDAKRAWMLDESCGGLARWSKVLGGRKFNDGALRGVNVDFQVYFRTLKDKPDQQ